ncbi:MAG: hypothetical protein ACT4P4_18745 [Betaproteobacteria bacterium]
MSRIVCGLYDRTVDADAAVQALRDEGFVPAEIDSFYVPPPGQNALTPIGGDVHSDAGARTAGRGAAMGALIGLFAGLAFGLVASIYLGEASIFLGALLGALLGAFAGTMIKLHNPSPLEVDREHPVEHRGGRMIAVNVDRAGVEDRAMAVLRGTGARDLGRTHGEWRDGSWQDFDPRTPLAA